MDERVPGGRNCRLTLVSADSATPESLRVAGERPNESGRPGRIFRALADLTNPEGWASAGVASAFSRQGAFQGHSWPPVGRETDRPSEISMNSAQEAGL